MSVVPSWEIIVRFRVWIVSFCHFLGLWIWEFCWRLLWVEHVCRESLVTSEFGTFWILLSCGFLLFCNRLRLRLSDTLLLFYWLFCSTCTSPLKRVCHIDWFWDLIIFLFFIRVVLICIWILSFLLWFWITFNSLLSLSLMLRHYSLLYTIFINPNLRQHEHFYHLVFSTSNQHLKLVIPLHLCDRTHMVLHHVNWNGRFDIPDCDISFVVSCDDFTAGFFSPGDHSNTRTTCILHQLLSDFFLSRNLEINEGNRTILWSSDQVISVLIHTHTSNLGFSSNISYINSIRSLGVGKKLHIPKWVWDSYQVSIIQRY